MTTTLNLDDDLAALLARESTRSGVPIDETVNRLLRSGLKPAGIKSARAPFQVTGARSLGLPAEWTSNKVEDLLDILEGPDRD